MHLDRAYKTSSLFILKNQMPVCPILIHSVKKGKRASYIHLLLTLHDTTAKSPENLSAQDT